MARRANNFGTNTVTAPITDAEVVDLSSGDYTPTTIPCRAVYVGVAGDLKVITADGTTITFENCPLGVLPVMCSKFIKTGTAADKIKALF